MSETTLIPDKEHIPLRNFGFKIQKQQRNKQFMLVTLLVFVLGIVCFVYWWNFAKGIILTNDAYVTGNIIPLKAQTSGTVVDVKVEDTQYVQQGEVLIRLDGLDSEVRLERAEANLADSVRQVESLFKRTEMLQQKLFAKQARLNRSQQDLKRYLSVAEDGVVSEQQIEDSEFQVIELQADAGEVQAELDEANVLVHNTHIADHPKVLQSVSALKQAYLDRVRQQIVAPVSGFVAKRGIQIGEQVKPDMALMAIVPLDYLWIEANFLENELADVQPGQAAEITVDLYGSAVVYHGVVMGLAAGSGSVFGLLPPNNATGNYIHIVERVPVRIALQANELLAKPLRPGISAQVIINTRQTGQTVLQPLTSIPESAYKTDVYDDQLIGAQQLIDEIIQKNSTNKSNRKSVN